MPDIFTAPKEKTKIAAINKTRTEDVQEAGAVNKLNLTPGIRVIPGIFSALVHNPDGFTFADQKEGEKIIIFARRHFFTNFLWILITFGALFVPLIFSILLQITNIELSFFPLSFMIFFHAFYYLVVIGYAFYNYADWFYNIGIVTQKRLIDIDFMHLTYIDVAITQLSEVEDVIYKQQGFFASFFDYGEIIAHTVATIKGKEDFIFENIPHPTQVVDIISKLLGDSN